MYLTKLVAWETWIMFSLLRASRIKDVFYKFPVMNPRHSYISD